MAKPEEQGTARVTMIWPAGLKETVRQMVGSRGLTDYTLDAVRARLNPEVDSDTRLLIQRMADAIATGGDYEDRAATLRSLDLPEWVDRSTWPDYEAGFDKRVLVDPETAVARPIVQKYDPTEDGLTLTAEEVRIDVEQMSEAASANDVDPAEPLVDGVPDPEVEHHLQELGELQPETVEPVHPSMREDWHIGRSFGSHPLEDECPCPQEGCGLVDRSKASDSCIHHALHAGKTMRQGHLPEDCPARFTTEESQAEPSRRDDQDMRDMGICPTCSAPLINGECWTCDA